jgi:hypothetical protein
MSNKLQWALLVFAGLYAIGAVAYIGFVGPYLDKPQEEPAKLAKEKADNDQAALRGLKDEEPGDEKEPSDPKEKGREAVAKAKALTLRAAAKLYRAAHGSYPITLGVLTLPDETLGGKSLVEADMLLDPWGTPYEFVVEKDEELYVFTVSPMGKKIPSVPRGAGGTANSPSHP